MKKIKRIVMIILLICIAGVAFFICRGYSMYEQALANMSIEDKIASIESQENYTKIDDMPKNYTNAVVAVEDHRFYTHGGIDIISVGRAIITNIKEMDFVEGGSTITQQLAKNIYFTQDREITRKIAEVFMAIELEKSCSKDKILELYVNTSYFGSGYYDVKSACEGYFDKEVQEMDLYECTLLAGIPNAPSVYDPTVNPDLAQQRQKVVLSRMVEHGYIDEEAVNSIIDIRYDTRYV